MRASVTSRSGENRTPADSNGPACYDALMVGEDGEATRLAFITAVPGRGHAAALGSRSEGSVRLTFAWLE